MSKDLRSRCLTGSGAGGTLRCGALYKSDFDMLAAVTQLLVDPIVQLLDFGRRLASRLVRERCLPAMQARTCAIRWWITNDAIVTALSRGAAVAQLTRPPRTGAAVNTTQACTPASWQGSMVVPVASRSVADAQHRITAKSVCLSVFSSFAELCAGVFISIWSH